jgi:hypothetical protein
MVELAVPLPTCPTDGTVVHAREDGRSRLRGSPLDGPWNPISVQSAHVVPGRFCPTVSVLAGLAAADPVTVHDLHATMLHLLGIDHQRLTYLHNGRRYRLTDVAGNVLTRILA